MKPSVMDTNKNTHPKYKTYWCYLHEHIKCINSFFYTDFHQLNNPSSALLLGIFLSNSYVVLGVCLCVCVFLLYFNFISSFRSFWIIVLEIVHAKNSTSVKEWTNKTFTVYDRYDGNETWANHKNSEEPLTFINLHTDLFVAKWHNKRTYYLENVRSHGFWIAFVCLNDIKRKIILKNVNLLPR